MRFHVLSRTRNMIVVLVTALLGSVSFAQPSGGKPVSFGSKSLAGEGIVLNGMLWEANQSPPRGAVVLVHSSGGWSDFREGHYARSLSAAGYAAMAIDSFGPRGITQTADDQAKLSALQMTVDAFAARRFLLERGFPPNRLAVMGFSKGGNVALYVADKTFLKDESDRFRVSIAFYPGCNARPIAPKPANVVFMALGEKDDYTGVTPCLELAKDFEKAGGNITVKIYPNSTHAFDGNPASTGMVNLRTVENYMDCIFFLYEDGTGTYQGRRYEFNDLAMFTDMRKSCMKKGAFIWTNLQQKEAATADVINFLNKTLVD